MFKKIMGIPEDDIISVTKIAGNVNTMTHSEKLKIESILEGAFPSLTGKNFIRAYETLLPNFEGFITLV